jgi:hypothetical protein
MALLHFGCSFINLVIPVQISGEQAFLLLVRRETQEEAE